jgi:phosphatidate cytidylyltransferase
MTGKRTLSAAVMLGLFFISLFVEQLHWLLLVVIVVFGVMCLFEIAEMIRAKSLRFPYVIALPFVLILVSDGCWANLRHGLPILAALIVVLLAYRVLCSDYQNLAAEVGAAFLATVYIGLPMGMAMALSQVTHSGDEPIGHWLLTYQVCVVFGGDTAAYFVGRRWGRRPFFPKLSPKKTIEGAVASVVVSVAAALVLTLAVPGLRQFFGLKHGLVLGAIMGVMAPLGDLAESAFKRDAGRKDSGNDFTGHGGFLDILDAVLFGLPIQFCYIQLFIQA